ncbi:helix-turn-helix domain-containing protein [Chitinophaga sp. Cy-1792]|uniref:helix-turn-helix domain-containing protein n=1 Tax=Chitinophaga sp. Cy-1792 TaxID=2608339 RepID=UPI001421C123|nr:helix-turn-helix transcriptional regulator [Chitinophaga sp. Cy-1792]NIG53066.1 helix-turn-helix transcriptional regulator [Chitinophaga sp. Cy-1792]
MKKIKRYDPDTTPAIICENIKRLRLANDWTQAELSDKSDISESYITKIERKIKNLQSSTVAAFAEAFDVPVDVLYTKYHPKNEEQSPSN